MARARALFTVVFRTEARRGQDLANILGGQAMRLPWNFGGFHFHENGADGGQTLRSRQTTEQRSTYMPDTCMRDRGAYTVRGSLLRSCERGKSEGFPEIRKKGPVKDAKRTQQLSRQNMRMYALGIVRMSKSSRKKTEVYRAFKGALTLIKSSSTLTKSLLAGGMELCSKVHRVLN